MAKMKQSFDSLGNALNSGNIDDAKKAFAQLEKNAPDNGKAGGSEFDDLKKSLETGDLKGAQEAYSKIQEKMAQGPPAGAPSGGASKGAAQDTVQLSSAAKGDSKTTSSENKSYDKMDANKDGSVTAQEELIYKLTHPSDTNSISIVTTDTTKQKSEVDAYV
jgi:hypothetical protein